jgi:hypothetical protein
LPGSQRNKLPGGVAIIKLMMAYVIPIACFEDWNLAKVTIDITD